MKKYLDKIFIKFVVVGVINTVFGTTIMFIFYNVLHLSYWISSASNYFFASILSYCLNKKFTFGAKDHSAQSALRFAINIAVCYLLAYSVAKPIVRSMLAGMTVTIQENVAMLAGMCIFTMLNYIGQRYFVFQIENEKT